MVCCSCSVAKRCSGADRVLRMTRAWGWGLAGVLLVLLAALLPALLVDWLLLVLLELASRRCAMWGAMPSLGDHALRCITPVANRLKVSHSSGVGRVFCI